MTFNCFVTTDSSGHRSYTALTFVRPTQLITDLFLEHDQFDFVYVCLSVNSKKIMYRFKKSIFSYLLPVLRYHSESHHIYSIQFCIVKWKQRACFMDLALFSTVLQLAALDGFLAKISNSTMSKIWIYHFLPLTQDFIHAMAI